MSCCTCRSSAAHDWAAAFDEVAAAGFEIWALTPSPTAADIFTMTHTAAMGVGGRCRGTGPARETLARCTNVRIPMCNGVDSLNVGHAVAAALAR